MDFYYKRSMGNGTIASKFRLKKSSPLESEDSDVGQGSNAAGISGNVAVKMIQELNSSEDGNREKQAVEFPETHHPNNCNRCYRLKKKCTRSYPKCSNCSKIDTECEYVNRSNKRRKKGENGGLTPADATKANPAKEIQLFDIENEPEVAQKKADTNKEVVAHRLVTIRSLLSSEISEEKTKDSSKRNHIIKKKIHRRESRSNDKSVAQKLQVKTFVSGPRSNLKDEFVTMKPIEDVELPNTFASNYFINYESKYPFLDKFVMMKKIDMINFQNETIVNLDVYLLMSIGCLIYDANCKSNLYNSFFSEKTIASIVDVLSININIDIEEDFENITLLLLLTIYGMSSYDEDLCWELLGVLNRLVVKLEIYKSTSSLHENLKQRLFWSIYNLDVELSLLLDRPSQLPSSEYIQPEYYLLKPFHQHEDISIENSQIQLSKLRNTILDLKLKNEIVKNNNNSLTAFSKDLERWRVSASSSIHNSMSQSPYLQDCISLINLEYYYLLIELDQISNSESSQFTLQFLSNSFSLLIKETSKTKVEISLLTFYWFKKFFKVIGYSLKSLSEMLKATSKDKLELILKFSEFNGNLQLIINLLHFISHIPSSSPEVLAKVKTSIETLTALNLNLIATDANTASIEKIETFVNDVNFARELLDNLK